MWRRRAGRIGEDQKLSGPNQSKAISTGFANVPIYVYGFSDYDVVSATSRDDRLMVTRVASRGGHSTYRVFLPEDTSAESFLKDWTSLAQLGCTYERATSRCVGIDVPPLADIYVVFQVLEEVERLGHWPFEEGH